MLLAKENLKYRIVKNAIRCNYCGDIIESTHRHDYKTCSCGRVAVDGGHDYLRRCFTEIEDFTDLSKVIEDGEEDTKKKTGAC